MNSSEGKIATTSFKIVTKCNVLWTVYFYLESTGKYFHMYVCQSLSEVENLNG